VANHSTINCRVLSITNRLCPYIATVCRSTMQGKQSNGFRSNRLTVDYGQTEKLDKFAVVSVAVTIEQFSSSWRNPTSRCLNVF